MPIKISFEVESERRPEKKGGEGLSDRERGGRRADKRESKEEKEQERGEESE